ncbi:DUF4129 domain-containing protein [Glycomyces terrestris]|uniref:DUF4129 domain-containing protein n=1 Tax=Glycomyces terrestris TaxID=2493553 RepID=A0A426UUN3_9ACTN|nr:DUF4129 domain-containing protein [Glycomyces terrestris]RRR97631.1 DUF4129 domain-containing protein [Glycomyces terrestris]
MTKPAPAERPALRRWLPVGVVAAALLVVGIAAQGTGLQWEEAEPFTASGDPVTFAPPVQSQEPPPSLSPGEPGETFSLPAWITWALLGVLVGVPVLIILVLLARRVVDWLVDAPESTGVPEPEPAYLHRDFALVEDAIAAALAEMDLGADARSAIMACWVHFERAAESVGIEREPSDTPADLVRKLLSRHDLNGRDLNRLTDAYLRARYSPHDVGEADRERARDALVALRTQLGVREAQ